MKRVGNERKNQFASLTQRNHINKNKEKQPERERERENEQRNDR